MEDDIVERLRLAFDPSLVSSPFGSHDDWEICLVHEAADEIERLRMHNIELMRLYYGQDDSEQIKELQKENAQLKHRIMRLEGMP